MLIEKLRLHLSTLRTPPQLTVQEDMEQVVEGG